MLPISWCSAIAVVIIEHRLRNLLAMTFTAGISLPRLVVLDTSHLAGLAADWVSGRPDRRHFAQKFVPNLIDCGWLPLICWHQIEELLQHENDDLVDARLRFIRGWPLLAWVRPSDPNAGVGSVLDLLKAEVAVAYAHPDIDAKHVRDLVRDGLFAFGSGVEAIPDGFRDWRLLRAALAEQQEDARMTTAISRWRPADIDNTRISDWMGRPSREVDKRPRVLRHMRNNLAGEIEKRGDKRISNPGAMADDFILNIGRDIQNITAGGALAPAIQILVNAGLEVDDIDPSATFGETMRRLIFLKRLKMVAESNGLPWQELKRRVCQNRLPVIVIEESMRAHAQDQPERKGSDLNDTHLLCFAPYADITYVDKRTHESVRRARGKAAVFDQLIGQVRKAGNYREIPAALAAQ